MLIDPSWAAWIHIPSRSHNSSDPARLTVSCWKDTNRQTTTTRPTTKPKGNANTPQTGSRATKNPQMVANNSTNARLEVGTHSADCTDHTTTMRFNVSKPAASQPS